MSDMLKIESNGIPFNVRIVRKGDKYGLNDCLNHDVEMPLVEFYDARYMHTERGQFVSRYNLDTLLNRKRDAGIDLDGGVKDWKVNSDAMIKVSNWLEKEAKAPTKKNKP